MKTVLYLDELLLVNFALGAALLLGAGLLAGRSCTGARLLAGSGAAAWAVSWRTLSAPSRQPTMRASSSAVRPITAHSA